MADLWGVDVGGTKLEAVVMESSTFRTIYRHRIPTERHLGYDHIVGRIELLIREVEGRTGRRRPDRIGFGTPGSTQPSTGLLKGSNTVCLNGRPFGTDLAAALEVETVLANDANCFALAEARLGAAQGYGVVFGVILGTGVGGGLVIHGRVWNGANGIAGEWGHHVLEPDGPPCYCGKRGCVETLLSGPALEGEYRQRTGRELAFSRIAGQTQTDPDAAAIVNLALDRFGRALSNVVNILDPEAIVLGGGVGQLDALYTSGAQRLAQNVFNPTFETPVLRPSQGDSAGVLGAAMLTLD